MWHAIRPLHSQDILNPATALIIPHIEDTLTRPWLHWRSTEAVKLPKQLQLVSYVLNVTGYPLDLRKHRP